MKLKFCPNSRWVKGKRLRTKALSAKRLAAPRRNLRADEPVKENKVRYFFIFKMIL